MVGEVFWLARGACAACGGAIARRAEDPGPIEVSCNHCRATTRLEGVHMLRTPTGVVAAPARAAPEGRGGTGQARRWAWAALGAAVLLVVGATAAAIMVLDDGGTPALAYQDVSLYPETRGDEVAFRFVAAAFAEGDIPTTPADDLWWFARVETLGDTPASWTECSILTCTFRATNGTVVLISTLRPSAGLPAVAFDTRTWEKWRDGMEGTWEVEEWDGAALIERRMVAITPMPAPSGAERRVSLYLNMTNTEMTPLTIQLVQDGVIVRTHNESAEHPFGILENKEPWIRPLGWNMVAAGTFIVEVLDEGGSSIATASYETKACAQEFFIDILVSGRSDVAIAPHRCEPA